MLLDTAIRAFTSTDTHLKVKLVDLLYQDFLHGHPLNFAECPHDLNVGFPTYLQFVTPKNLTQRKGGSRESRMAMLHAIAHIEFNAINLALDAMLRFKNMPKQYYIDWLQVAREEAYHFTLLEKHLNDNGYHYGDFPVHGGLWEMAEQTQYAVLVRMALVPRLLEARGLDMAPLIMQKLKGQGDTTAYKILWIILHDEVGHVSIGNRWYHWCCLQQKVEPLETFKQLLAKHAPDVLKKPFNWQKRLQAGFNQQEQSFIENLVM